MLLAMAAIMTVVLSTASRSVTDISITSSEENALRAFSAAEAGIEKALLNGTVGTNVSLDSSDTSIKYTSTISTNSTGAIFGYPSQLKSGESASFWMVSHDANGKLSCSGGLPCYTGGPGKPIRICWGNVPDDTGGDNSKIPAIEVSTYYDTTLNSISTTPDYSNVKVEKYTWDPNNGRANGFTKSGIGNNVNECEINNLRHLYRGGDVTPIGCGAITGCVLLVKVKMFYNDNPQRIGAFVVGAGNIIPAQGNRIESTGTAGESTRKVNVFQSYSEPPSIFDGAVFSLGDFKKI